MSERPESRSLMIVTAGVGTGHHAVTRALTDALRHQRPPVRPKLVEALSMTPWPFRLYYAGGFAMSMSRAPRAYGFAYQVTNRPHTPERSPGEQGRLWLEAQMLRRFGGELRRYRPELVVNTHLLSAPYVARLRRSGDFDGRQVVVVTDIEIHRYWYAEEVERYFVPTTYTADSLRRWGIPSERITVSGVPVHPRWTRPLDRRRILDEWGLPDDRPVVLLSGGTAFTCGPVLQIARRILRSSGAHLVALAGRNKRLFARFAELSETTPRVTAVALTDRMPELVEAASLMVTKAGGIITAECLAKATPMVLLNPVPGHEEGNAAYLARESAAVIGRTAKQTAAHVRRLLSRPDELERMVTAARRLHRPGARIIAQELTKLLQDGGR